MEIYHGSNIAVTEPLANAGRRNLDFGKGFYTTRLKSQAQKWAYLVASRKEKNPQGIISKYEFDEECLSQQGYVYKNFPVYDMEWLEFVVVCREGKDETNYDIVEGGVANDQVIDTVEDYENGRITAEQALMPRVRTLNTIFHLFLLIFKSLFIWIIISLLLIS